MHLVFNFHYIIYSKTGFKNLFDRRKKTFVTSDTRNIGHNKTLIIIECVISSLCRLPDCSVSTMIRSYFWTARPSFY